MVGQASHLVRILGVNLSCVKKDHLWRGLGDPSRHLVELPYMTIPVPHQALWQTLSGNEAEKAEMVYC